MKTSKEIGENMLVSGATSFTTSLVSSFVCDKIFQPGVYDGVSISKKESFVAGLFFGVAIDVIGGKISYERTR